MLEIGVLRNERQRVLEGLAKRSLSWDVAGQLSAIVTLDDERRKTQTLLDDQLAAVNRLSKDIGQLMKSKQMEDAERLKVEVLNIKEASGVLEESLAAIVVELERLLIELPNVPHASVRFGTSADDNELLREGIVAMPDFEGVEPKPHWDLAVEYSIFDLKAGAVLTGSGFPVFTGRGARLQRALINFFLDKAIEAGYQEVSPPHLVNADTARATGQLPDKEGQMYYVERDELYLIPTAEVPITNLVRGKILQSTQLPMKFVGYTPCFRREAGSYGADVKGLNRVHQFDKVEIVQIVEPEQSYQALDEMVSHVESLLKELELPYRILRLCGGDMGFTSALTYDFEVYSAAQDRWLEVSSVSNFETFQSNRLKLRIKKDKGALLAHTLNGSALALARIIAALMENFQRSNGIALPTCLAPYVGDTWLIKKQMKRNQNQNQKEI